MKEKEWLERVWALAMQFGWRAWHVSAPMKFSGRHGGFVPDPRGAGIPDLILIHDDPPRMILAELKGKGGKVSDKQREFLQAARAVTDEITVGYDEWRVGAPHVHAEFPQPVAVYCWFPDDEPMVEQILRSRVLA